MCVCEGEGEEGGWLGVVQPNRAAPRLAGRGDPLQRRCFGCLGVRWLPNGCNVPTSCGTVRACSVEFYYPPADRRMVRGLAADRRMVRGRPYLHRPRFQLVVQAGHKRRAAEWQRQEVRLQVLLRVHSEAVR